MCGAGAVAMRHTETPTLTFVGLRMSMSCVTACCPVIGFEAGRVVPVGGRSFTSIVFGTAAWKLRPSMGVDPKFMKEQTATQTKG
jgi:hypothetical protein